MLGAAIGRGAWLDQEWRKLYPMLNLLLIGPSGIGKTTALEVGMEFLINRLPESSKPQVIAGQPSPEKLHFDLMTQPHSIIYAEELASFITKQRYMESLIPYLTELLNYKAFVEKRSHTHDILRMENPSTVVLGGSTVDWLQEQLPDSAVGGGFLPRFLIVYEEFKWRKIALPAQSLSKAQKIALSYMREESFERFLGIVLNAAGPIPFSDFGVADVYTYWYSQHTPVSGHLEAFSQRAGEFVLRLSLLLALSCGHTRIIEEDIKAAIRLYEYTERSLQKVVVPMSVKGKLIQKVLELIGQQGVSQVTVRRAMRNYITSREADDLVQSLLDSRDVVRMPEDGKLVRNSKGE